MKNFSGALKKKGKEKKQMSFKENPAYPKAKKGKITGNTKNDGQAEMLAMGKC